jgi:hypothetical protein
MPLELCQAEKIPESYRDTEGKLTVDRELSEGCRMASGSYPVSGGYP